MGSFENDRKWVIEKKNDVAIKSMDLKDKIDEYDEKRNEVEEGISRIPADLPEELQQRVHEAVENARAELRNEASELDQEADQIKDVADEAIDTADYLREEYKQKAEKLRGLCEVPLLGSFAETEANKLDDQAEQMTDLREETAKYRVDVVLQQNRIVRSR